MRSPTLRLCLTLLLAPASALAGWSSEPTPIRLTTSQIPLVDACSDGDYGTFVAWQEDGVVRVQHVLATGDVDPAWPVDGVIACATVADRAELQVLSDRLGGVYLLWRVTSTHAVLATRIQPNGAVAPNWPSAGRALGTGSPLETAFIEDAGSGFYAAWTENGSGQIRMIHLGAGNTGAGGWLGVRTVLPLAVVPTVEYWPQLALASDGGVFVASASWSSDEASSPSYWRLRRLNPAGNPATGWPDDGIEVASFHTLPLSSNTLASMLGLSPDGRGGVFMVAGRLMPEPDLGWIDNRLYRFGADGSTASGWPTEGRVVPGMFGDLAMYAAHQDISAGYRLVPDGNDGAVALLSDAQLHDGSQLRVTGISAAGAVTQTGSVWLKGTKFLAKPDGGVFIAAKKSSGPYGYYEAGALLQLDQTLAPPGWTRLSEYHNEPLQYWYGDIGLAPSGDGGVVFFWSQSREIFGLFARRFNTTGQVTGVEPGASHAGLGRVRFVAGAGVRAAVSIAGTARLELFDLAGRRLASQEIAGAGEHTLAGTRELAAGLYFARLSAADGARSAKVMVAR